MYIYLTINYNIVSLSQQHKEHMIDIIDKFSKFLNNNYLMYIYLIINYNIVSLSQQHKEHMIDIHTCVFHMKLDTHYTRVTRASRRPRT
ncbi:hypothetical protein PUN28_011066 [Cardiocondyla obscurior]|uniref:Uncharacterized protein n=1 Tax=Cardiocondyla obscurior TaxID=286306 RepID=A0AAW2FLH8_9HYME